METYRRFVIAMAIRTNNTLKPSKKNTSPPISDTIKESYRDVRIDEMN